MRASFIFALLMTHCGVTLSQNYTLPTSVLDSMIWEVSRGRACDSLRAAQSIEIQKYGNELVETNKALKLSESITEARENEVKELRQALIASDSLINLKEVQSKRQFRKGLKVGSGLGLSVTAVVLMLLL